VLRCVSNRGVFLVSYGSIYQNLTPVSGGHYPRRAIEHRTEVVPVPKFGFTGCDAHPHRQFQPPLCGHRRIHC
jgi:hypothetical protein